MSRPVASFHILVSLADGDRHGYSIMQDVAERPDRAHDDESPLLLPTDRRRPTGGASGARQAVGERSS